MYPLSLMMRNSSNLHLSRHVPCLFFLLLTLPSWAYAFPKFVATSPSSAPSVTLPDILTQHRETSVVPEAVGLTAAERRLVFRSERTLASFSRRSDCSNTVATSLQKRCGDELEEAEDDRIRAAIALTKCDLATAGQTPPLECSKIQPSKHKRIEASPTSPCVAALSRSPQHWSTYSGYLREIPMLCFALKRQMEVDAVKEVYANISQEKIALLKVLKRGAEGALQRDQDQEAKLAYLAEYMKTAANELNRDLVAAVHSVRMASQDVSELAQSSRASEELKSAAGSIVSMAQQRIEEAALSTNEAMELRLSNSLDALLAEMVAQQALVLANSTTQLASRLDVAMDGMQRRLDEAGKQISDSVGPLQELLNVAPQSQMMMDQVWALFRQVVDSVSPVLVQVDKLSDLHHQLSLREQVRAANMSALLDRIEIAHTDELALYARREAERARASTRHTGLVDFFASLLFGEAIASRDVGVPFLSQLSSIDSWCPTVIAQLLRSLPLSESASMLLLRGGLAIMVLAIKVVWSALCLMLSLGMLLAALSTRLLAPLLSKGWAILLQASTRRVAEAAEEGNVQRHRTIEVKQEPPADSAPTRPPIWQTTNARPAADSRFSIPPYRAALDFDEANLGVRAALPTRRRAGWERSSSAPL